MKQNQQGPYNHYERPQNHRDTAKGSSNSWLIVITIFVIIIIALVPIVLHLSEKQLTTASEQPTELRKVKRHKKTTKRKVKSDSTNSKPRKEAKKRTTAKKKQTQYVVQSGDSLSSIAQKYNMSVAKLAELNGLDTSAQVDTGQVLKLK